jgi:phosphonate transport system permease protein
VAHGFDLARYTDASRAIWRIVADATPPDFSRSGSWLRPLADTLAMSVAATIIGSVLALPLAFLAARNTGFPAPLSAAARLVLNVARSIPELVFGIVFVAAVGFGPLPGVLALACHSVGMLGKFMSDQIEHVDPAPSIAMRSQGVSPARLIRYCLLPQIWPRVIDVTLYRWEHNVRAASVMGMIGAGGLGLELMTAFGLFEYQEAFALMTIIFLLVTAIDSASARLRSVLTRQS